MLNDQQRGFTLLCDFWSAGIVFDFHALTHGKQGLPACHGNVAATVAVKKDSLGNTRSGWWLSYHFSIDREEMQAYPSMNNKWARASLLYDICTVSLALERVFMPTWLEITLVLPQFWWLSTWTMGNTNVQHAWAAGKGFKSTRSECSKKTAAIIYL